MTHLYLNNYHQNGMPFTTEVEVASLFKNANKSIPIKQRWSNWVTYKHLIHLRPIILQHKEYYPKIPTRKRSNSINLRFWWLKDWLEQKQFCLELGPGKENLAGYTAKFQIPAHHKKLRPIQLITKNRSPSMLEVRVKIINPESKEKIAPCLAVTKNSRATFIQSLYLN